MFENHLLLAAATENPFALILLGLVIGLVAGFFGIGGGILAVPMLNVLFGVRYDIAVGTSLAVMFGTSLSGTFRHRQIGNIEFKLGILMVAGAVVGVESGARIIELLKKIGSVTIGTHSIYAVNFYIPIVYFILLTAIGIAVFRESRSTKRNTEPEADILITKSAFIKNLRRFPLPPLISLSKSAIPRVSLWIMLAVGLFSGLLSGMLGVGGAFFSMPMMIYLIGLPTTAAIGTSLFTIIFSSAFGSFTHAIKGNVNFFLVGFLLIGSIIGAQLGAVATKKIRAVQIRYYFSILIFLAAIIVLIKLLVKIGVIVF